MNELKSLNPKNLKKQLDKFNNLLLDNESIVHNVIEELTRIYLEIFPAVKYQHHEQRKRIQVDKYQCKFTFNKYSYGVNPKPVGIIVHCIHQNRKIKDFYTSLYDFIRVYDDKMGIYRMETLIFPYM